MTFPHIRTRVGSRHDDTITGSAGRDLILALAGDDFVFAGGGNDTILAGSGDDTVQGGAGSDLIEGGSGTDRAVFEGSFSDYQIVSWSACWISGLTVTGAGGVDTLLGIEEIYFEGDGTLLYLDGRNNGPRAGDDTATTGENGILALAVADLLANDSDFDGDTLAVTAVSATSALGVAVTLSGGTISYDPGTLFDGLAEGETVTDSFTYEVSDGRGGTATATVTVTITGTNDAPELTLAPTATISENTTAVATATAFDPDSTALTFAIAGGADASLFTIDAATGALSFLAAPDFEAPGDAGGDNVYDVIVSVSDGSATDTAAIAVTVTDEDEGAPIAPRINEIHYDNEGADQGEFIEVRVAAGDDVSGMVVQLYNGSGGAVYGTFSLGTLTPTTDGTYDYYVITANGLQNGAPDGIALSDGGALIEFLSYEGTFTGVGGAANGVTSTDIGFAEGAATPVGHSLQRRPDGTWAEPGAETRGAENEFGGGGGDATFMLISELQGSGATTAHLGERVEVEAIVTHITDDGFFLQEEDSDADGNAATSEGVFVFVGASAPKPAVGSRVSVTGTATEFFGETQIGTVTEVTTLSTGNPLPTAAAVLLGPDHIDFETVEGMRVSVTSGTADALTVTENFNLDRFGEIEISAGNKTQPTQIYDAQTQAAQIAELAADNLANRLIIDDGNDAQNPTSFGYVPASVGDDGDGILDAGDAFGPAGPTLRLGAEITAPVEGVMFYAFGDYRMLVDGQLQIDPATNEGARPAAPTSPGGVLQVASMNVLNFFTTLPGSGGSGPNDLEPRGATSPEDLARQTAKIVDAILASGAEVLALQELENNGFDPGSAIATLVAAVNAEALARGMSAVYAFVDPTGGDPDGFIGTDAITTGIIYDTTEVGLVTADYHAFAETSSHDTFAKAEVLNAVVAASARLEDLQRSRPVVAATFEYLDTHDEFTVVSTHLKSKGDSGLVALVNAAQTYLNGGGTGITQADIDALKADANYDQGNGQAFWNGVRAESAAELVNWIRTQYAGSGTAEYLLLGDFNSYSMEDPVQAVTATGAHDLIDEYIGREEAYSFVFDGQRGTLDQAFVSTLLSHHVTGLTEWHINADEPDLLNYSSAFNDPAFYSPDRFAAADHDPLIVGLHFESIFG